MEGTVANVYLSLMHRLFYLVKKH